ncbi:MAG TPA: OpgC domain-containing protein, partial [Burkholderiaceae bacterium]
RLWELDAARGLMLVLMTLTHLPTRLTTPLGQPLGFVSAAEGFVLLSAFMAGMVYGRVGWRSGVIAMRQAFLRRALKIYRYHAVLLFLLFTVVAAAGSAMHEPAVRNLMSFYLRAPLDAITAGLLLVYQPPLLDILPMYVLFMLVSPWLLGWGQRHGWIWTLAGSAALWLGAQFGLSPWLYSCVVAATSLPVPYGEMGAFDLLAWQLVWVLGLWLGWRRSLPVPRPLLLPRPVVWLALLAAAIGMAWRHWSGQAAFGADEALNLLFDKWLLGPLRLLNLLALVVLALRFGPACMAKLPRMPWLELLGTASLPVFCAQLLAVLLALTFFGDDPLRHAWWVDALLLAGSFALLTLVARWSTTAAPAKNPR